jgi:hypothetical protein
MSQGGHAWAGYQLPKLQYANSNGYSLWVEGTYDEYPENYIALPSWMNGVAGQTITLKAEALAVCSTSPLKNERFEIWQMGSSSMGQEISCVPNTYSYLWGYYILESPKLSSCTNGWNGICQLPDFSTVGFTGNICSGSNNCENINSNNNAGLV